MYTRFILWVLREVLGQEQNIVTWVKPIDFLIWSTWLYNSTFLTQSCHVSHYCLLQPFKKILSTLSLFSEAYSRVPPLVTAFPFLTWLLYHNHIHSQHWSTFQTLLVNHRWGPRNTVDSTLLHRGTQWKLGRKQQNLPVLLCKINLGQNDIRLAWLLVPETTKNTNQS